MTTRYFVGLDLGQAQELSALAVLERSAAVASSYAVRCLRRWPVGTSYPALVADVAQVIEALAPTPVLAVDATAVGRPVADLRRRAELRCPLYVLTITAGHAVGAGPDGPLVPKRELISTLQVLPQSRRLKVAHALPDAGLLVRELSAFRAKVTTTADDALTDWRNGAQDDLVLAVAVAAWVAENRAEPYTGPLCYNTWAPWPADERGEGGRPKSRLQEVLDDRGIDLEGDW